MSGLSQADEIAIGLAELYQHEGVIGIVIRSIPGAERVRVIGMQLPPEAVAKMLHSAADAYLAQAPELVRN